MKKPTASCRLLKRLARLAVFAFKLPALVLMLVLVLLSALQAAAQTSHVLIVENLEKPEKNRYYYEGDFIIIHLAHNRQLHKGRIQDFTDSSLQINMRVYLLREIDYVKVSDAKMLVAKGFTWALVGYGVSVLHALSYWNKPSPEPSQSVYFVGIAGAGIAAAYFSRHAPNSTKPLDPATGYRIRMKKVAQPAIAAETTGQNQ